MSIEALLAEQNVKTVQRTPVASTDAVLGSIAVLGLTSPDANRVLAATINTVRRDRPGCRVDLHEGFEATCPGVEAVARLDRIGYLRNHRIDRENGAAHLGISRRLSPDFRDRLTSLHGGARLELAASTVVATSAERLGIDLDDLARNVIVRFADGTTREIDVVASVAGRLIVVECKLGRGYAGEGGRFADLVGRLGLPRDRALLLATGLDPAGAADLAAFNPDITVADGRRFADVADAALRSAASAVVNAVPTGADPAGTTTDPVVDRAAPAPSTRSVPLDEIESAIVRFITGRTEPITLADLVPMIRDELVCGRRPVNQVAQRLLRQGRCFGPDGQPVDRFIEPISSIVDGCTPTEHLRSVAGGSRPAPVMAAPVMVVPEQTLAEAPARRGLLRRFLGR